MTARRRIAASLVTLFVVGGVTGGLLTQRVSDEWGGGTLYEIPATQDIAYRVGDRPALDLDGVIEYVRIRMARPAQKGEGYAIKPRGGEWSRRLNLHTALNRYAARLDRAPVDQAWAIRSRKSGYTIWTRKVDLNPAMVLDTVGTPAVDIIIGTALAAYPDLRNWGIKVCKYIRGTNIWSQHAWGNAVDFGGPIAMLDRTAEYLRDLDSRGYIPLGLLLWRTSGHWNHIHAEGDPKMTGTPPCARW